MRSSDRGKSGWAPRFVQVTPAQTQPEAPEPIDRDVHAPQAWQVPSTTMAQPPTSTPKLSRKKPRIVMTGPPNVPIPTQGWPRLLYLVYRLFHIRDRTHPHCFRVPPLSEKERESRMRTFNPSAYRTNEAPAQGTSDVTAAARQARAGKHPLPESRPRSGLRGLFWMVFGQWLYRVFGWEWLTRPSRRERYHMVLNEIWQQRQVQKIYAVVNSKGGACKTMLTAYLGKLHKSIIKQSMVALDANVNSGHTAKRLGILREATLQLRTFIRLVDSGELETPQQLLDMIDWEKETGVGVIASEAASNAYFSTRKFMNALFWLKAHVHSVWCDLGNGLVTPSNVGSVAKADTLIFPALATSGDALDDIETTQNRYAEVGNDEKVRGGIIVIVGVRRFLPRVMKPRTEEEKTRIRRGEDVEDTYATYLTQGRARRAYAERYNWPVERVFIVPRNHYMAKDKPARLSRIPLRVKLALAEILLVAIQAEIPLQSDIDTVVTAEYLTASPERASGEYREPVQPSTPAASSPGSVLAASLPERGTS